MNKLPRPYQTIWLTYEAIVSSGHYGDTKTKTIVRRRAFYSKSDGHYDGKNNWIDTPNGVFQVPQYWSTFTTISGHSSLQPRGHYSYGRVYPSDIIKWELDKS